MKGFARIFEAIIASVILLASLTYFFVPNTQKSGWDDASLQALAQDAIESAYLNGTLVRYVNTDDRTQLNAYMSSMLPKTVDFSLEVSGIPNGIIYVSCIDCTEGDKSELLAILNPTDFQYHQRNISMRVDKLDLSNSTVPADTNILFFFDKTKIRAYESKVNASLSQGKSVFLMSDLTEADMTESGSQTLISRIFNLTWANPETANPSIFESISDNNNVSYFAAKYYANISSKDLQDVSSQNFAVFMQSGVKYRNDGKDIARTGVRGIADANDRSTARVNYKIVNNEGRSVWMEDYTRADHSNRFTKAIDNLTKASFMWASGEEFKIDSVKKQVAPVNLKTGILVFDKDTYIVELILWRIFY